MADLILGKDVIAFFRRYADRTKQDAGKVRFQSELSIKPEKNVESTKTKEVSLTQFQTEKQAESSNRLLTVKMATQ